MTDQLIETLARKIWDNLPYDSNSNTPTCPTVQDAIRAVKAAVKEAGVTVEAK